MPRRPTGVWIVCGYLAVTQLSAVFSLSRALLFPEAGSEWAVSYYSNLPWWGTLYLLANAAIWLGACTALFLMRPAAFPLFLAAAVVGIMNIVWQALEPWTMRAPLDPEVAQPLQALGLAVSAAILLGVVAYVWRLKQSGALEQQAA